MTSFSDTATTNSKAAASPAVSTRARFVHIAVFTEAFIRSPPANDKA
jgi:hypothetical protein